MNINVFHTVVDPVTRLTMGVAWGQGCNANWLIGRFVWPRVDDPLYQRLVRFEFDLTEVREEVQEALAALLDSIGPIPSDVWGELDGQWLRTRDGVVVMRANVDLRDSYRLIASRYLRAVTDEDNVADLVGMQTVLWVTAEVGHVLDPP